MKTFIIKYVETSLYKVEAETAEEAEEKIGKMSEYELDDVMSYFEGGIESIRPANPEEEEE